MKYLLATIGLLIAVAGAVGLASFKFGSKSEVHEALLRRDALAWLKADFHLNDAQFAAIRKLHESYSVVCEEHCRAIQEAAAARSALKSAAQPDAGAIAAAERRWQETRQICETAIATHVRQVAAEMAPAEGRRYLALVLPKIADFDHRAAPDLGLNVHHH